MHPKPSISIIIPAYNEEGNLPVLIPNTFRVLKKLAGKYEVVVVNDGSRDRTAEVLGQLKKRYKQLRVITHAKNKGVGAAMKRLFKEARYDYVLDLPGDNQQHPEEIPAFLKAIKDADVVCGYRKKRVDAGFRLQLKRLYHFILFLLYGIKVRDIDWVKMYRRKVLQGIDIKSDSAFVLAEAVLRAKAKGYRIAEVAVTHHPRLKGKPTGAKMKVMARQLWDAFKLRFTI